MKKLTFRVTVLWLAAVLLAAPALARGTLIPVGQAVGLELTGQGLTVAGFDERLGADAQAAGLAVGDTILKANGQWVHTAAELTAVVASGDEITLTLQNRSGSRELALTPADTDQGPRLGILVREGITGIGTVTYYDPETGRFGALGHGVSDAAGELLPLSDGKTYPAEILSVRKGHAGQPGQLQGAFRSGEPLGALERNTRAGVFGRGTAFPGIPLPVAETAEIHTGRAVILSDLTGGAVQEYDVEIQRIHTGSRAAGRNLLLKVTDPALLEATGGIVQGMSGSPIIQDGRLIGAVTHVLIDDPTQGYGILIENMLEAAA